MNETISKILERTVNGGHELGVQCALALHGKTVADVAAGCCDCDKTQAMGTDTLIPVFSAGKVFLTTAALRVFHRLGIDYSTRVCDLWSEFSGDGKEKITLSHILNHTSGMFCMPHADTPEQFVDWQYMCRALCQMRPSYLPGTRTKYQAFTYSWLLGEPLQRLTGKELRDIIRDEVIIPAGIDSRECYFGVPMGERHRIAQLQRWPGFLPPLPPKGNFYNPTERMMESPLILGACLPAFNCCASARALAKLGIALLDEEKPLIPPEILSDAARLHRPAGEPIPQEVGRWDVFGYGFILYDRQIGRTGCFGHGGYAGAELIVDLPHRAVFAFSRNRLTLNNEAKLGCLEVFNQMVKDV